MTAQDVDITRYTYRVTWSVEDDEFVATCLEFPSLSWLADTQEAALGGLRDLMIDVVGDLRRNHEPVPEPSVVTQSQARHGGCCGNLSLNQYVVRRLTKAS